MKSPSGRITPAAPIDGDFSPTSISPNELSGGDNLLQSGFWASFKSGFGWTPHAFHLGSANDSLLVLERRLPGGLGMAYVPHGPDLPDDLSPAEISTTLGHLSKELHPHMKYSSFMIRYDLRGGVRSEVETPQFECLPDSLGHPLRKAPYRVQPPVTLVLDLLDNEEILLSRMRKKTRYNIRLAEKKGVGVVRLLGKEALELLPAWYELYRETGIRDGISLHKEGYYRRLFELSSSTKGNPVFSLYIAEHEGDRLAGIIVCRMGRRSTYMYGASGSLKRSLMPGYLLQWRAIRDAKSEDAAEYDFFGLPPTNDPKDPMHGLWRFKTGLGGGIRRYLGAWDHPWLPVIYGAYSIAESLRARAAALRKRRSRR